MAPPAPAIIAHRGGEMNFPANTLCAFRKQEAAGVDGLELDVQVTKNGEVVVFHPEELGTLTTATGKIADKTSAEVTALDVSSKFAGAPRDSWKDCTPEELRIPLLTTVFAKITKRPLIIDLKSLPANDLVNALVTTIPANEWGRIIFYSTNADHTKALREKKPDAAIFEDRGVSLARFAAINGAHQCITGTHTPWIGYELVRPLEVCDVTKLGRTCVTQPFTLWTPESVACARNTTGGELVFFGVDTEATYVEAGKLGARAVYSNNPLLLLGTPDAKTRKKL